jgi:D-galactose 1-dehydrogenase
VWRPPEYSDYACERQSIDIMTLEPISVGLAGLGKIARDQHVPTLSRDPRYRLAATADPSGASLDGVPSYRNLDEMLEAAPGLDAVSLCVPPQLRSQLARTALGAGKHVLLEKPPGISPGEVEELAGLARDKGLTLFTAWHSQFAPAAAPAKEWLAGRTINRARITWKEDVREWHPNQEWIWRAGGFGVFDPGINALSIATMIMPQAVALVSAALEVPENCETPIAAKLAMTIGSAPMEADFDFRQVGKQTGEIAVGTDGGELLLWANGAKLSFAGVEVPLPPWDEYPGVYGRFADLIGERAIDVDLAPMRLVADALRIGSHVACEPFFD